MTLGTYLAGDGGPHFQSVVVRAADNSIPRELEARNDVIVMTFQHFWRADRLRPPVHLDIMLPHVGLLPRRRVVTAVSAVLALRQRQVLQVLYTGSLALLLPQQIVVREETPIPASLCRPQEVLRFQEGQHR